MQLAKAIQICFKYQNFKLFLEKKTLTDVFNQLVFCFYGSLDNKNVDKEKNSFF